MKEASADESEMTLITDAMVAKESPEELISKIQNERVFLKAILNRTQKSLEHLKAAVERYRAVFDQLFEGDEGQM